jgi:hypothetical protein
MKQVSQSQSGVFAPRAIGAFLLCSVGVFLAMFGFAAAIPDRRAQLASELPKGLSAAILPAPQFKPDSARKNFVAQTNTGWSIVSSPNINTRTEENSIQDVACVSASDCWAVGESRLDILQTLIEHWDGNSWSIVSSPNAGAHSILDGVTCVSASDCWAVGAYYTGSQWRTLIERWDGISWTIVASPNASASGDSELFDVTCASGSDCWAVGYSVGLIEHWNGTSWSIITSPNPIPWFNILFDVACASASDCWAVGFYDNNGEKSLIEHWDGSSWTVANSPNTDGRLSGVFCTSASDCWAVGGSDFNYVYQTLIEHWDGSAWALVTSPNINNNNNYLNEVTCTSVSDCWAVGQYYNNNSGQALIEHWNGSSWGIVTSPNLGGLNGIACVSTSQCWAVGAYSLNNVSQTLMERWNGNSWDVVVSPNVAPESDNVLTSVGCASESDCWSVGYSSGDSFIQRWDGNSWTIVAAPRNSSGGSEALSNVICTSASECWSTGNGEYEFHINYPGTYYGTFIDRWNGSSWSISTTPYFFPGSYTKLNSVACASPSDCWAVGDGYALIMHWNGSSWSYVAAAPLNPPFVGLNGVTCSSASECWAVGSTAHSANNYVAQTLIERWDGVGWTVISSPNTSDTQPNTLINVVCASGSDCWAVGYYVNGNGKHQALIERWNGTSWAIVPSPSNGTQDNQLNGVTCALATDCRAVGSYVNNFGKSQTLIEQWDGTSWGVVSSPNTSTRTSNQLNGITCSSAADCWAVGIYRDNTEAAQTLIEHWTAPVKLVSAVSRKAHGSAGNFDINLPLTSKPGIECRSGGPSGTYQVIATFAAPVTMKGASVIYGSGSASSAAVGGSQVTVNLTGVTNAQTTIVRIAGVNDGTNSARIDIPLGVLLGDTTANGSVNASDLAQTKAASGQGVSASTFREDVTADGVINASDTAAVKSASGTAFH